MKKVVCFLLALLMAVVCVACNNGGSVDDGGLGMGYTIDRGVVILCPQEDGTVIMEIGENTTLGTFYQKVTADQGYRIAVMDQGGKVVDDPAAVITDGMVFYLYEGENTQPLQEMAFQVVDPQRIQKHYQNIAQ